MKPVGLHLDGYTFVDEQDMKHGYSGKRRMKTSMRRLIRGMKRSDTHQAILSAQKDLEEDFE